MNITVKNAATDSYGYDALVRFISERELKQLAEGNGTLLVEEKLDQELLRSTKQGLFKTSAGQTIIIPTLGLIEAGYVIYAAASKQSEAEDWRLAGAAVAKAAKSIKAKRLEIAIDGEMDGSSESVGCSHISQSLTEGLLLAIHTREADKKEADPRFALEAVQFTPQWTGETDPAWYNNQQFEEGISVGQILYEAVAFSRDLVNLPGNVLTPEKLAMEAEQLASEYELDIEVLDEWEIAEQGMGGLLGVGQGSANPPRMIVIHYNGNPDSSHKWGLVGKGITFDTGGISLKTAAGMEEMISDMGGAATVLGAVKAAAALKYPVNIVAVIPSAENMPSDRALKPGDVLKTLSGLTVEVVNTDAEGRLVLADGITAAIQRGASRIIDVATLTGAVLVALGTAATGAITNDDSFVAEVIKASKETGEKIWPLPSFPEYQKQIKSDAADLKNSGGRHAGTITAGLFLGHFAKDVPWVHLDIAGTAFLDSARGWEPKGATGVMVRTLARLLSKQN